MFTFYYVNCILDVDIFKEKIIYIKEKVKMSKAFPRTPKPYSSICFRVHGMNLTRGQDPRVQMLGSLLFQGPCFNTGGVPFIFTLLMEVNER